MKKECQFGIILGYVLISNQFRTEGKRQPFSPELRIVYIGLIDLKDFI
jgi:hypothetical protein